MGEWHVGQRPERDHKLSHNKREWSPERCIFLDTETGNDEYAGGAVLPLRSWECCVVWRDKPVGHPKRERWFSGRTGLELASLIDELVTTDKTTWVWAHNLGFDLATTRLPVHLPRLGWQWTVGTITTDAPWMKWRKKNKSLTAVDSFSHLPMGLGRIGDAIGLPKLQMPAFDASAEEWDVYRHRDVLILRDAVLQYLEWWDSERLGNLSVSGPASGWNVWRHTTDKLQVYIDPDAEQRQFGRAAIYGGRRSAWRVGDLGYGPWVEIDIKRAHLTIMRTETTPIASWGWLEDIGLSHEILDGDRAGVVADCIVRTEEDRYPLLTDAGVLYPTGEFRTRLAGPEIREARRRGELVAVERGLAVALGRPMRQWGEWIESGLAAAPGALPAVAQVAMKGWSRTVIGKWAGRTSREVLRYPWPEDEWKVETGFYNDSRVAATTIYGSGEARTYIRDQESHDSFPAAYAWITSHMRIVLNRLLDAFNPDELVACNTDSVVVHLDGLRRVGGVNTGGTFNIVQAGMHVLRQLMAPYRISVKHVANELRIRTPEHLVFDGIARTSRKIASVAKTAREVDPWAFEGDTWPGLAKQLTLSGEEAFHLIHRHVDVSGALPLAWVDKSGCVYPPHVERDRHGNNYLWALSEFDDRFATQLRLEPQHPGLLALLAS